MLNFAWDVLWQILRIRFVFLMFLKALWGQP